MTFRDQGRWSLKWSAIALLTATAMIGLMILTAEPGIHHPLLMRIAFIPQTAIAISLVLFFFGVVARSAHCWLYLRSSEGLMLYPRITLRERFTTYGDAGFFRWWLHIDEQGKDRDA